MRPFRDRAFHDILARYVANHACEVRAETGGCPHLTPEWDDDASWLTFPAWGD